MATFTCKTFWYSSKEKLLLVPIGKQGMVVGWLHLCDITWAGKPIHIQLWDQKKNLKSSDTGTDIWHKKGKTDSYSHLKGKGKFASQGLPVVSFMWQHGRNLFQERPTLHIPISKKNQVELDKSCPRCASNAPKLLLIKVRCWTHYLYLSQYCNNACPDDAFDACSSCKTF